MGESIESLGEALNVILSTISNRDPAGLFQMHREKTASWQFTYDMCAGGGWVPLKKGGEGEKRGLRWRELAGAPMPTAVD